MRKKILLLAVSLSILLAAVYVYQRYLGSGFVAGDVNSSGQGLDIEIEPGKLGSQPIGQTDQPPWMAVSDPDTGRRQVVFQAKSRYESNGMQILDSPDIVIYPPRGGELRLTGKKASLVVDDVGTEVAKGSLIGDVVISIDLVDSAAASQSRHIEIHMEKMDFDYELQEIRSSGKVKLLSDEVTLSGSDLLLQWNSAPDELRVLRLSKGGELLYHPSKVAAAKSSPERKNDTNSIDSSKQDNTGRRVAHSKSFGYVLTVEDDVTLESKRQNISGADSVRIVAALGNGDNLQDVARPSVKSTLKESSTSKSDAGELVGKSGSEKSSDDDIKVTWSGTVLLRPVREKDTDIILPNAGEFSIEANGKDMQLSRDGIIARCEKAEYFSGNHKVIMYGGSDISTITLDGGSKLSANDILFDDSVKQVRAIGAGSIELSNEDIHNFSKGSNSSINSANISWKESVVLSYDIGRSSSGKTRRYPRKCEFQGNVVLDSNIFNVRADKMAVDMKATSAADSDGKSASVMADAIIADGNVHLEKLASLIDRGSVGNDQAEDGLSKESLDSDSLAIKLGLSDEEHIYPLYAHAVGNVKAISDTRSISADDILLNFAPQKTRQRDEDGHDFEPVSMLVKGRVTLSDIAVDSDEKSSSDAASNKSLRSFSSVVATGKALDSDLITGTHKLYGYGAGKPAKLLINQREQILGDPLVIQFSKVRDEETGHVVQELKSASISGSGKAMFMLDKGIDGKLLPRPRPAIIRWSDRMAYHSTNGSILFLGDVQLDSFESLDINSDKPIRFDSVGDHLRSDFMTIELADFDQLDQLDSDNKRNMVHTITAKGKARMLRRWHDEDGFLRDRSQLSGSCIVLDQLSGQFIVLGEGSLLVEDYRAPNTQKTINPDESLGNYGSGIESPSQTLFKWDNALTIVHLNDSVVADSDSDLSSWTAFLDGSVAMRHRSGSNIVSDDSLNVRSDYDMPAGTVRHLDCRNMLVQFIQNTSENRDKDSPRVQLSLFEAVGDVYMVDGDFEAQGGRVIYDMDFGRALISGDETGSGTANAKVFRRSGTGSNIETTSPKIMLKRSGTSYEIQAVDSIGRGQY